MKISFFIWFSILQFILNPKFSSSFTPSDNFLINCGSSSNTTLENRVFSHDKCSSLIRTPSSKIFINDENPDPNFPQIYHTASIFRKPSSYIFQIQSRGVHMVRLHFYPFKAEFDSSVFSVYANGFFLLNEFHASNGKLVVKEYLIDVQHDELALFFVPKKSSFAFVNAIEVVSLPNYVVPRAVHIGERLDFDGFLLNQALEVVYKVNMGGKKITPFNDTLFRYWVPDEEFLKTKESAKEVFFGGPINFEGPLMTREIAPDRIYRTAQSLKEGGANLAWVFPAEVGYKYFVRFHFCDIVSSALYQLYFNVDVNGWRAYSEFSLSNHTNGLLAAPFYGDFIVDANNEFGGLTISIGPVELDMVKKNALLNGLEIWKLNNSMGSLDGEVSQDQVLRMSELGHERHYGNFCFSLFLVAMVGLVGVSIVLRRRFMSNNKFGWMPLSVEEHE